MPKSIKLINDFSGGLVNAMHSRDIPDNALSTATNVQVTKDGAIEPISNVIQLPNAVNSTINLQSYTSGNSVYSFKHTTHQTGIIIGYNKDTGRWEEIKE